MNSALDDILASYSEAELAVVTDFLSRTVAAGRQAADRLSVTR